MIAFLMSDAFASWALQTGVAVAVLIAMVLILRKPVAQRFGAKVAYALWMFPVVRLALPPLPSGWNPLGWISAPTLPVAESPAMMSAGATPMPAAGPAPTPVAAPEPEMVVEAAVSTAPSLIETAVGVGLLERLSALPLVSIALAVWAAGTILMLTATFARQARFARIVDADSHPAPASVTLAARDIARRLGMRRTPIVRTSLLCSGPLVTGLARPIILLPEWFHEDYDPGEQREALTHELMHVRRGDLWALQAAQIILAVQWFNPLAHLAMKAFRADQEAACDADVLGRGGSTPHAYGKTLVKAVRLSQPLPKAALAAGLPLNHAIKDRLLLMQRPAPSATRRALGAGLLTSVGMTALVLTASPGFAQDDTELEGGDPSETADQADTEYDHHVHRDGAIAIHIDGEPRMILLGDPFKDSHSIHEKISDLDPPSFDFEFDFSELEDLEVLGDLDVLAELSELEGLTANIQGELELEAPFPPLPPMPPMPVPQFEKVETENGVKIIIPRQEIEFSGNAEAWEAWAEQVEAQAEAFAARIEARSDQIEANADRIAARAEAQAERMAARVEARAERIAEAHERKAERYERDIERLVERELEPIMDDGEAVVDALIDACNDQDDPSALGVVGTRSDRTGETYKAICHGEAVSKDEIDAFVDRNIILTPEEKAAYRQTDGGSNHRITFGTFEHED